MLQEEDRKRLLALARDTVAAAVRGGARPGLKDLSEALQEKGAAFVTLKLHGHLRGCIGHVEAHAPLWESVREMAEAAAIRDPRFTPVSPEEVPDLKIEISVLSPMTPIRPEEVEVGRHGLMVRHGMQSGLLLPKVAVEWKWTAEEFLKQTFLKAGIPPGTPGAKLFGFTADCF